MKLSRVRLQAQHKLHPQAAWPVSGKKKKQQHCVCFIRRCRVSPWLQEYLSSSTMHGLRYVVQPSRHWSERVLWILCCSLALTGTSYTSWKVWDRFQKSPIITVLETTNFPITNLPFPAVTICNNNHVYWNKALQYEKRYLNESGNETVAAFRDFLHAMSAIEFGDFDKLHTYFGSSLERAGILSKVDMMNLMLQVTPSCQELFAGTCWWRNAEIDCCHIFQLQKTEYGFCYSFNSGTSENTQHRIYRPRRTGGAGVWSGLRVLVNCAPELIPPDAAGDLQPGVVVIVHHAHDFPMTGSLVPAGSAIEVPITAQLTESTPAIRGISLKARKCLYHDEGQPYYSQKNCIAMCHRNSAFKQCHCVPYFFPSWKGNFPVCDARGFLCLAQYNDVFNYEKPAIDNELYFDDVEGMICNCSEDCIKLSYAAELYGIRQYRCSTQILLDVHFKSTTMVKYRMDVVFDWLSLTVSLGGIASLFLGCSLLSAVEVFYYLTFRLYSHMQCR